MPCDTVYSRRGQTMTERKAEVRAKVDAIAKALGAGRIKARVGPQGAVAFEGIRDDERSGITDACIYRRIMVSGSALARHMLAKAEQMAGRTVDRAVIAQGTHSHDGGGSWDPGH